MKKLPAFRPDRSLNVVIESPRGSMVKFKYDPEHEVMSVSRPLPLGLTYPFDWGFIPSTRAEDGDPLDAFVLWEGSSYPGIVIPCRAIGVLNAEQTNPSTKRRARNDRVAVLPIKAPRQEHIQSVRDLTPRVRSEIERFFLHVVAFEEKKVKLLGWGAPDEAEALVRRAARTRRGRKA
jgi:inorganic pyrophosphatase